MDAPVLDRIIIKDNSVDGNKRWMFSHVVAGLFLAQISLIKSSSVLNVGKYINAVT